MIRTLSTFPKDPKIDSKGIGLFADAQDFLNIKSISEIRAVKKFYLEGVNDDELKVLKDKLLVEEVWQDYTIDKDFYENHPNKVEVAFKKGMMNPEVRSLLETAEELGITNLKAADTCFVYYFFGDNLDQKEINAVVNKLVMNSITEEVRKENPATLIISGQEHEIEVVKIRDMNDEELMKLSKNTLFLTLDEMHTIQNFFKNLGRDPYDCELEVLAQSWSEHCGHKTFKAKLTIDGKEVEPLYRRLKNATKEINHPNVVSAFVDNSGV